MEKLTSLVIDRSKWNAGQQYGECFLKNSHGFQCCLGFFIDAIMPEEYDRYWMASCAFPGSIYSRIPSEKIDEVKQILQSNSLAGDPNVTLRSTIFSEMAANVNDNRIISNQQREETLITLFKGIGVTLTFVGEYATPITKSTLLT